tara:strand:+ start:266 stop:448 length:183 start_codon:yes stop_codon:yes gene_type:complete
MAPKNKEFFVTCSVCKLKESDWVALLTSIEPEEHTIMCRVCFIKSQAKPDRRCSNDSGNT